jgi:tryptophan synthase beta subunit
MFYPFAEDPSVKLLGVEAGGDGVDTARHSATLSGGRTACSPATRQQGSAVP